jgi:chemotaxis protein MotA
MICLGLLFKPEFFDPLSLLLTLGGALTVTWLSYTKQQLWGLWYGLRELINGATYTTQDHAHELRRLTELFRLHGIRGLENQERHLQDGFLRYGVELLVDLHTEEKIRLRLEHRIASVAAVSEINRQILTTLGRLLPSFGLIGTLIGMVLLLGRITALDPKGLPGALGLSVLTTLYGAVSANCLVAPLLARLQSIAVERETNMNLTKEWILTIACGDATLVAGKSRVSLLESDLDKIQQWGLAGVPVQR